MICWRQSAAAYVHRRYIGEALQISYCRSTPLGAILPRTRLLYAILKRARLPDRRAYISTQLVGRADGLRSAPASGAGNFFYQAVSIETANTALSCR